MNQRLLLIGCIIGLMTAGQLSAEIPQIVNYQGKVTDLGGMPVADGDYTMRFRIYDAASGGTLEWDSGDQTVAVSGGIFFVLLGKSPQPAITLEFDEDYWLLVTLAGDDQNPRNRLGSVGYAYMASGLIAGTEVIGSVDTETYAAIKATNTNTSTTDITYGVYGSTAATEGFGVVGIQPGYTPESDVGGYLKPGGFFGGNNGVMGVSKAQYGFGVLGLSQATTGDGSGGFFKSDAPSGKGVYGEATATTGINYGVYGSSFSNDGRGVYGYAESTTGNTYGVYGRTASTSGRGVYGYASTSTGTTYGVHGQSASTDGTGVFGYVSAMTGLTYGGRFESYSTSGTGVYGIAWATTDTTYGGRFESYSPDGTGVYGYAGTTTGGTGWAYGVIGECSSPNGTGVYGHYSRTPGVGYGVHYGVHGKTASTWGRGVYGEATATTTEAVGVWGKSFSTSGRGVYGEAEAASGNTYGVQGVSASTDGTGVCGLAGFGGETYGVYGRSDSESGTGVYGCASYNSGTNYGVYAKTWSPSGYAGYFEDDVHVNGTLTKASGSFLIDHPLDPENKLLRHNFVESPENLLIYRGKAELDDRGEAVVEMPDYFGALTTETHATVNLTPIGRSLSPTHYEFSYEWGANYDRFEIYGQPGRQVAWMVMAERSDPVIQQLARPVEEDKGPDNKYCDRGKLLHPTAYGYPESMGRNYERQESMRRRDVALNEGMTEGLSDCRE